MATNNYNIVEDYTLPSLGKVYEKEINPNVRLRSMTTNEEMKRLSNSERPYKNLCDIIDACLVDELGMSSYDLCLGDYQYLLYKLRVVTYGKDYQVQTRCPLCKYTNTDTIDLNNLVVKEYSSDLEKYMEFDLPKSEHRIRIRMQTPRMLDDIQIEAKDIKKKRPEFVGDPAFLFLLERLITHIDGEKADIVMLEKFVRDLPMADTNYIIANSDKLNTGIGVSNEVTLVCDICGFENDTRFAIGTEFFRPTVLI